MLAADEEDVVVQRGWGLHSAEVGVFPATAVRGHSVYHDAYIEPKILLCISLEFAKTRKRVAKTHPEVSSFKHFGISTVRSHYGRS
jgi:hypothetical protein